MLAPHASQPRFNHRKSSNPKFKLNVDHVYSKGNTLTMHIKFYCLLLSSIRMWREVLRCVSIRRSAH